MIHNGKMSRVVVLRKLFRNVCILYAYYWRLYFSGMHCGEFIWILLSFHGNAVSDTLTFISTSVGFHENVGTISISTQTDSKKNTWVTQEFLHWYSAIVFWSHPMTLSLGTVCKFQNWKHASETCVYLIHP